MRLIIHANCHESATSTHVTLVSAVFVKKEGTDVFYTRIVGNIPTPSLNTPAVFVSTP